MNPSLFNIFNPLKIFSRAKGYRHPGGIRYPGGILYYPRDPNFKEPEYTPSKLFRVERIKRLKYQSYNLKKIMAELKIDTPENRVTVVKNIPEVNARLWKVKHLIKITPIVFPYGEPTNEDIKHTILKENGKCVVTKTLTPKQEQIEALEQFDNDKSKMDSTTIKKDSRYKWNNAFGGGF